MAAMEANIFKLDNSTVDVLKLISEMWRNRSNESLIRGLAETLIPFVVEKRTLCEIEFYLPQLASLILYLEAQTTSSQAMEYLAIAISQASINCALQLTNYFAAAMEDFQPELATGAINPKANQTLYYRAARLFQNVQRAVVYGSPVLTSEQERFMMQQFSQATLDEMFDSEKTEAAGRIVRSNLGKGVKMGASDGKSGRLYFKAASGSWGQFFCKVDQRVLFFFKDNMANAMPVRCVPLDACEVAVVQNPSQPYTFTVTPRGLPTTT
jgi:phosphatidylinositol 4-kinase